MNYILQAIPNFAEIPYPRNIEKWLSYIEEKSGPLNHRVLCSEQSVIRDVLYQETPAELPESLKPSQTVEKLTKICARCAYIAIYSSQARRYSPDAVLLGQFEGYRRYRIVHPRIELDPEKGCSEFEFALEEKVKSLLGRSPDITDLENLSARIPACVINGLSPNQCLHCSWDLHHNIESHTSSPISTHNIQRCTIHDPEVCYFIRERFQEHLYWILHDRQDSSEWCSTLRDYYRHSRERVNKLRQIRQRIAQGKRVHPSEYWIQANGRVFPLRYVDNVQFLPQYRNQAVLQLTGITAKQLLWASYKFARTGSTLAEQSAAVVVEGFYQKFLQSPLFQVQPRYSFFIFRKDLQDTVQQGKLPWKIVEFILNIHYRYHVLAYITRTPHGVYHSEFPIRDPLTVYSQGRYLQPEVTLNRVHVLRYLEDLLVSLDLAPDSTTSRNRTRIPSECGWEYLTLKEQFEQVMIKRNAYDSDSKVPFF